jgi:hypothetical protein
MSNQVWSLSVDLQTKTATFSTGLADAARNARGSFADIKDGAADMARSTSGSMMESRHGVQLVAEEFGVHLPRALTTFVASIGPVGEAMAAAFPFLAIVVGATLLLEHLAKLKEAGEALTRSQEKFGTTVANVLGGLNDKLLEAGIRTDELNNDHLGALEKQLQLIDHASLKDLVSAFDTLAKGADLTFAQLKTSWYQFGAGSTGAKHALEEFQASYESLLAKGAEGEGEAADLLAGTRKSAEHVLALQKQIGAALNEKGTEGDFGDLTKVQELENELKKTGAGYTTKEIEAQETLVEALRAQAQVQDKVNALKKAQTDNAVHTTDDKIAGDSDKAAREQAANQRKSDDEAEKLREEAYKTAVEGLQENERQKIAATREGSAARLAAIDAAIKEEEGKGLQETGFYKSLLNSRVNLTRQMDEEIKKLNAEAGKESAEHTAKMGELMLAADRQAGQLRVSEGRMSLQERLDMEMSFNAREYDLKKQELQNEITALDTSDKEYENKKKALNNKILELDQQLANQDAALTNQAQQKEIAGIQALQKRLIDAYANGFTQVLMRKESFSHMMRQMDTQMATDALKSALQLSMELATVQGRKRFGDARTAAADAFASAGNPILGTVLAATTFAEVMALESGGIVPGVGKGDIVPARLEPGEGVLNNRVMDGLRNVSRGGGSSGGDVHNHFSFSPQIHAVDSEGVDRMLTKHHQVFQKHIASHARRLNS